MAQIPPTPTRYYGRAELHNPPGRVFLPAARCVYSGNVGFVFQLMT